MLTKTEAADVLNVSLSFLAGLVKEGKLSPCQSGAGQRFLYQDIMKYKQDIDARRMAVLDELAAQAQALGLY